MKILLLLSLITTQVFAMNKGELTDAMAMSSGIEKGQIKRGMKVIERTITKSLKKGDSVSLVGFGTFSRIGRDTTVGDYTRLSIDRSVAQRLTPRYIDSFF